MTHGSHHERTRARPTQGPLRRTHHQGPRSASSGSGGVGRYTPAEQSGRYTGPPRRRSATARWFGPLILFLMIFGVLTILLNYLTVLPGSVSIWYLVAGLVIIFTAFIVGDPISLTPSGGLSSGAR